MATTSTNGAELGFEQTLWAAADKLRGHLDAAEYKHVVLGLIFLKYISDAFQEIYNDLAARQDIDYTDPEDRDEYTAMVNFTAEQLAQLEAGEPVSLSEPNPPKLMLVHINRTLYTTDYIAFPQSWSWLQDGTLIVEISEGVTEALVHFDPATGAGTIIDDPTINASLWEAASSMRSPEHWRTSQAFLSPLGLDLMPPTDDQYGPLLAISPNYEMFVSLNEVETTPGGSCRSIALTRKAITVARLPEIIYQTNDPGTLGIGMLEWLPDETLLFVLQTNPMCDFIQAEGSLIHLMPSGEAVTLATHLVPTYETPCAITPDGSFAACKQLGSEFSSIVLITVADGTTRELLVAPTDKLATFNGASSLFHYLHWLIP